MSEGGLLAEKTFPACLLLEMWWRRLRHHAHDPAFVEQHQAHLRQALILTARQRREAERLWRLLQAAHDLFMARGWVHTWACTLQRVAELWPQLAEQYPLLVDHLAAAWCAAGQWARAQTVLQQSKEMARDPYQAATLWLQQAALLWNQGRWEAAYRLGQQAWHRLPPGADALTRTKTARLLLLASWRLHRFTTARYWGRQALKHCPKDQPRQLGLTHHFLFLISWAERQASAERHLEQALQYLQAADDRLNLAHVLADSTEVWITRGCLERAEEALFQSYSLWRDMEAPAGLADYYRHAAHVAWRLGRYQQAREYADYALCLWQRLEHPAEVRRCKRLLQRLSTQKP